MRKSYSVKVWDKAIYPNVFADDETEAMNQAWEFFTNRKPEFDIVENADNPENPNFGSKDEDKTKMTMMITSVYGDDSAVNFVRLSKSNIDFLRWLNNNDYLDSGIKYRLVENEIDF